MKFGQMRLKPFLAASLSLGIMTCHELEASVVCIAFISESNKHVCLMCDFSVSLDSYKYPKAEVTASVL